MAEYIQSGYITPGYYETQGVVTPPEEGTFDIDVGTPGAPRHRTAAASTRVLELAYWQPGSPWAPYDVAPVFVLHNRIGIYAWSNRALPNAIQDMVFHYESVPLQLQSISFRSMPIASSLIGSIGQVERNQSHVGIPDPLGFWAKRIWQEPLVHQPGGLFWLVKSLYTVPALVGTVGRLRYRNRTLYLSYGDFRRDTNTQPTFRI